MTRFRKNVSAINLASREIDTGTLEIELAVPDIHCAGCINTIEKALLAEPDVDHARVNLTTKRVRVRWKTDKDTPDLIHIMEQAGFSALIPDPGLLETGNDELRKHILALAVAGFAAGNVMMLSLSVWSGADQHTRHLFHLISAAIALPALLFSSRIFFVSAWQALRVGRTNMDVPICVGIVMTTLLSIYDMAQDGKQVYFDAAIMLVFLLLIGRTLEVRMRGKVRSAVDDLAKLQPAVAQTVPVGNPEIVTVPVQQLERDDVLQIGQQERVPVDCRVLSGISSIDTSLITGESSPVRVCTGKILYSGSLNLDGVLRVVTLERVEDSFLAKIERQIDEAEIQKGRYQQLADRVVSYYTPFVHFVALLGFILWMWFSGDWHRAITVGITVLIITCPCALGLAVPIARVIASHQLVKCGVLMKNGAALERLAMVSKVIFDKTGTLTSDQTQLCIDKSRFDEHTLPIAQSLCRAAEHPYARAIIGFQSEASLSSQPPTWEHWHEVPGEGIEAKLNGDLYRLGRADWAIQQQQTNTIDTNITYGSTSLTKNGQPLADFTFEDRVREGASDCVKRLLQQQLSLEIMSGDTTGPVSQIAKSLNISRFQASVRPGDKLNAVDQYQSVIDQHVLMVGDGINDSPALAAASVSMVPGTGADMTRKMADFILLNNTLTAIPDTIAMARRSRRIVKQNLTLAVGYNVVALPLALTGVVTPLIAAVAMSASSVLVIGNSLRLASAGTQAVSSRSGHHSLLATPA